MVVRGDIHDHALTGQPSGNGHHRLEQTEVEGDAKRVPPGHPRESQSGADRYGKGIHRQTDRDCQQCEPVHVGESP